ncbi:unnamed protein product [Alopecurus aequalis]
MMITTTGTCRQKHFLFFNYPSHDCDHDLISGPALACRRDWANLDDGPAGLIAERVLAYDVADYVRFRAVCCPWRQCSTEPRKHSGLDRRFHPWRWTMLREEELAAPPSRHSFFNTSTGESVQVDIPEIRDYELLALTPEGLLVLLHKQPLTTVRLLNPLTRHLTELPPLTTLLPPKDHRMILDRDPHFDKCFAAWGSGIAYDDSTVVLCFNRLCMLGVAKPGDDRWTLLKYEDRGTTMAPLMLAGRLYCVNLRDGVMVLETSPHEPPRLQQLAASLNINVSSYSHSVHLINNFGELMLVHRYGASLTAVNKSGWQYDAYRVDLDTGTLFPVKSFGGNAVFMGMHCSLSVSPEVFPSGSISADTIYLSFDVGERWQLKVGSYCLSDGSVERASRNRRGLVPRPYTLVDCLSFSITV